jgi:hypothetical protein
MTLPTLKTNQLTAINVGIGILLQLVGQGISLTTEVVSGAKALWGIIHPAGTALTQQQIEAAWAVVISQDEVGLALAQAQSTPVHV